MNQEKWKYGKMEIRKNGHQEKRKLDMRKSGILGKIIWGKMQILKNANLEKFKYANLEKWKFGKN